MRKWTLFGLLVAATLALASTAFAAEGNLISNANFLSSFSGFLAPIALAAGLGVGLAALGCGIGMGFGIRGACEGVARNPEVSGKITVTMILGLALIESLTIYALVIALILLYANPILGKFLSTLGLGA
ncbi:MAG: ATP synthase F0 subunit C [Thermodesulfobacteria bacterium]|nr:ATP synthase F0 subunit C [Thermodesulfobacteriota bacterium]